MTEDPQTELEALRQELASTKEELNTLREYTRSFSVLETFTNLRSLLAARNLEIIRLQGQLDRLAQFPPRPGGLAGRLFRKGPRR